jgi:hypothetical protein
MEVKEKSRGRKHNKKKKTLLKNLNKFRETKKIKKEIE